MKGGKLIKLISINYVSGKEAQMIEKPDPLSVLGKKYTRETARHIPYGGLMNSEGIIIEVITEEQSKTQTKACKEHLIKLLASSD